MTRSELSIVIPFLNEDRVLPLLRQRLENVQNRPSNWELLFVSDGSTDASSRFIEAWASKDPSVKLIVLTRNFGHQSAVSAGLSFASGDCVGIMDADLQDEPEILLDMYRTLRSDNVDIVYAVPVQADSGDFCVMSRRAVRVLLSLPEKLRFVRGLRAWTGLPSKPFPISRPARAAGHSQYSLLKLTRLAFSGLTSFSTRPLRLGFICGTLLCLGAVVGALTYLGIALFTDIHLTAPGFSTLVIVLLFSNGLVFLYLGVLGEYIGQMFMEVKGRPSFIVERTINIETTQRSNERD